MKRRNTLIGSGIAALAIIGAGAGIAIASNDSETPITGDALAKASAAALNHTGGGQVTQTEVNDEDSYYQVEVKLADGSHVDVQLDKDFLVVGSKPDKD